MHTDPDAQLFITDMVGRVVPFTSRGLLVDEVKVSMPDAAPGTYLLRTPDGSLHTTVNVR